MSDSNDRFGRRAAQSDQPAEPVLSFTPRSERPDRARMRDFVEDEAAPRFGRGAKKAGPMVDADDRPLHLSEDVERGGGGIFGWLALAVVIVVVGASYAWHVYSPAPQAPVQGYTTPPQSTPNTANTTPANPPSAQALGAAGQVTPPTPSVPEAQSVATAPTPKSLPPTPVEAPRKTISDAAAEHPLTTTTPPGADTTKPAAPATHDEKKPATPPRKDSALDQPKPRTAAATPEPPMPNLPPPSPQTATTPQTATAPASVPQPAPVPQTFSGPAATGRPQPLSPAAAPANQAATAPAGSAQNFNLAPFLRPQTPTPATATAPAPAPVQPPAASASPAPGGANTVTVNGINYVNGEQPQALGTINAPMPDATGTPTPLAPPAPISSAPASNGLTPYTPSNNAPLPNDVIITPSGQMAVPSGTQQ